MQILKIHTLKSGKLQMFFGTEAEQEAKPALGEPGMLLPEKCCQQSFVSSTWQKSIHGEKIDNQHFILCLDFISYSC